MTHRNASWNAPYTFSGKEKDVETGYGYFGARYYDSGLSIWLSVDPMTDKYPSMSPYTYCANNPVILVDPDGEDWYLPDEGGKPIWDKNVTQNNVPEGGSYIGKTVGWTDKAGLHKGDEEGNLTTTDITHTVSSTKIPTVAQKGSAFDIDKAVNTLNSNAGSKSIGYCAKYVRIALEAGGAKIKNRPNSAKDYGPVMTSLNFSVLSNENYTAQKGDVAVFSSFNGAKAHPHGHIQMFNGTQWVSDFKQRGFYPGADYRNSKPNFKIYRFNNK